MEIASCQVKRGQWSRDVFESLELEVKCILFDSGMKNICELESVSISASKSLGVLSTRRLE